jgi:Ni,Fe-hydrogenase III small subunit
MSFWFWHGLQKGVHTTRYPQRPETAPGVSPGRPVRTEFRSAEEASRAAASCPVDAIIAQGNSACVELRRCIHCQRCHFGSSHVLEWRPDYEWTMVPAGAKKYEALPSAYRRSLHIMVVDAGDCGACLHEVKQLNNPFYNMHRLGMFFTATPRAADVLLVVGPVSENMRVPLLKTFEAMPDPKRVVAVGACAITGGVFGSTFMSAGGTASVLSVDLEIPGDPPPPLAILHGLLVVSGRKPHVLSESFVERGV